MSSTIIQNYAWKISLTVKCHRLHRASNSAHPRGYPSARHTPPRLHTRADNLLIRDQRWTRLLMPCTPLCDLYASLIMNQQVVHPFMQCWCSGYSTQLATRISRVRISVRFIFISMSIYQDRKYFESFTAHAGTTALLNDDIDRWWSFYAIIGRNTKITLLICIYVLFMFTKEIFHHRTIFE